MEASWHPNRIQNRSQLRKADFAKSVENTHEKSQMLTFWGRCWEPNSIKNLSKIEVQVRMPLGIELFIDFGGLWEASWEGKSGQEPSKMAPKKE